MTKDASVSDHPSSNPALYEPIENWLEHTSTECSNSLGTNRKRKRSTAQSSSPSSTSPCQPSLLESPGREMDPSQSGSLSSSSPSNKTPTSTPSKSTPRTPSDLSINNTKIKIPQDATWVKQRLRTYRCYQNEPDALDKYPEFKKRVMDILDGQRHSFMTVDSAKKFSKKLSQTADDNEDTFLCSILPAIIKDSRMVKSRVTGHIHGSQQVVEALEQLQPEDKFRSEDASEQLPNSSGKLQITQAQNQLSEDHTSAGEAVANQGCVEESQWVVEDFAEAGVIVKVNRELRKDFLPHQPHKPDTELHRRMAKINGMTNPRPDRTYGIDLYKYPIPDDVEISVKIHIMLEVVPLLHWPFFIIEGKSNSGLISEATNQACRGGASIMNAQLCLLQEIGVPHISGSAPDTRTFMFSATLSPVVMEIWVHWVEYRDNQNTIFHMHKLKAHAIDDNNAPGKLRKIIHNILDWGCDERFEAMKKIYDRIFDYERKRAAAEDEISTRSPKKKQKLYA